MYFNQRGGDAVQRLQGRVVQTHPLQVHRITLHPRDTT